MKKGDLACTESGALKLAGGAIVAFGYGGFGVQKVDEKGDREKKCEEGQAENVFSIQPHSFHHRIDDEIAIPI